YDWPRNLRELRNYTERCLLLDAGAPSSAKPSAPAPAPAAPRAAPGPPESICLPSSGIVGPRAKAGDVDHGELIRAYVTRIYVRTGQNKSETARLTGFDRRTVGRWIDPVRLSRLLAEAR